MYTNMFSEPENILCLDENDDTQVMITDFGLSKFSSPAELMKVACGTLCYGVFET